MTQTLNDIRSNFLDYFVKNNHTHVKASSLVPHNDPSLMFVNSGMVQFKNVFTGLEKREYTRATSSQKSVRAGGKHNDLDNVGYTARHHTFFEMLGNFSFGDYFKEEAIYYAWELLTKDFGLDKNKLYATIYHDDEEAYKFWKKISGFGDDRIIRISTSDNFWSMGDTGPCGPCSEIFYDHGDHIPGGLPGTPEEDGDRFIEIWNMVFMQYEQIDQNTRIDLPNPCIDTGMGLERISAVLQGQHDNYDTDLFKTLISASEELTSTSADGEARFSHRVIADHLRSSAFLIADGVMPSNEGRGYVLRRIMRRAMRHAHHLGAKEPLLYRLLPTLVSQMSAAYPELQRAQEFVTQILKQEEVRFKTTLDKGLKLLDEQRDGMPAGAVLKGDVAFKLYDTYGFPVDLTEDILKKHKITVDHAGFSECMQQQKEKARAAWSGAGGTKSDSIWFDIAEKCGTTEFLGYQFNQSEGNILSIIVDGKEQGQLPPKGEKCTIITNQTPFYGESGGQMGDIGTIYNDDISLEVVDTKKYLGKIHAHICVVTQGKAQIGDSVTLQIDDQYRHNLKAHHSATHILHKVLQDILGKHVTQKGSLVAHDRLRFDISHPSSLSLSDIQEAERRVNAIILQNQEVCIKLMAADDAIASGAMALFGEKYDDEVRVVSMGLSPEENKSFSIELCGGTHVERTGDIGLFKILNEGAIAAGVRRIEAVTGEYAIKAAQQNEKLLSEIRDNLKTPNDELLEKISTLVADKKQLEKRVTDLVSNAISYSPKKIEANAKQINGIHFVYHFDQDISPKILRGAAENSLKNSSKLVIVYVVKNDDKISILVGAGTEAQQTHPASQIIQQIAEFLGCKAGGGSPQLAQGGAAYSDKVQQLATYLQSIL